MHIQLPSCVWFFVAPWTVARQGPLFLVLFQQEYWSELSFPPQVHLLYPSVELTVAWGSCIGRQILYHLTVRKALLGGRGDLNKEKVLKAYKL